MSKVLKFKCPECGEKVLEEVMINVIQSTSIKTMEETENGDCCIDYGFASYDEGEVDNYQCRECGYVLKTECGNAVDSERLLVEWLKANCSKSKKTKKDGE